MKTMFRIMSSITIVAMLIGGVLMAEEDGTIWLFSEGDPPPENMTVTLPFAELWRAVVDAKETFSRLEEENAHLKGVVEHLRSENLDELVAESMDKMRQEIVELGNKNSELKRDLEARDCE